MTQDLMNVDPVKDSFNYLMVIVFGKSTSTSYPFAVSVAQGAAKYGVVPLGKQIVHLAAFEKNKEDASRALSILKYLGGSKTLQIFANGTLERNSWSIISILECYLKSTTCNDFRAHCQKVIENPFREKEYFRDLSITIRVTEETERKAKPIVVERYLFPCAYLLQRFKFQLGHPSTPQDQIQAGAVENHCEWCPNFSTENFTKLPTKIVMSDGTIIYGSADT